MTLFSDGLEVGNLAAVSAGASNAPVTLTRYVDISTNGGTEQFLLPTYVENFDAKCYILSQNTAATSDTIVVSAGGTTLLTFSSMGSTAGLINGTTASLGTVTVVATACDVVTTTSEVTASVTLTQANASTTAYRVVCSFNKVRTQIDT